MRDLDERVQDLEIVIGMISDLVESRIKNVYQGGSFYSFLQDLNRILNPPEIPISDDALELAIIDLGNWTDERGLKIKVKVTSGDGKGDGVVLTSAQHKDYAQYGRANHTDLGDRS